MYVVIDRRDTGITKATCQNDGVEYRHNVRQKDRAPVGSVEIPILARQIGTHTYSNGKKIQNTREILNNSFSN